jgi:hypothetical protein
VFDYGKVFIYWDLLDSDQYMKTLP